MPSQALKALAKLAHEPNSNFDLETEFGLRIDVTDGKFKVRIVDPEQDESWDLVETVEATPSNDPQAAEPAAPEPAQAPTRTRTYALEPAWDNIDTVWLMETPDDYTDSLDSRRSDLEALYSKAWVDAVFAWEAMALDYRWRNRDLRRKEIRMKPRPTKAQYNRWVFQGAMLGCWLALQDDVLQVKHELWDYHSAGEFTFEGGIGEQLQSFLKGYPWVRDENFQQGT